MALALQAAAAAAAPLPPAAACAAQLRVSSLQVVVSTFEETLPHDQFTPPEYARQTATHKALDVAQRLRAVSASAGGDGSGGSLAAQQPPFLVIGADTVVECGDVILEKPADAADAARMLRMLSGQRHHVHTGVALVLPPAAGEGAAPATGAVCLLQWSRLK